ncbi:MAG: HEAT repeat domain-containing protein [Aggregatilineales bacterium]
MAGSNPQIKAVLSDLRGNSKEKRRTAVMRLGMIGDDEAIQILITTLENEFEDLIVRGRAAMMLGRVGDIRAVAPLIRALDAPGFQTPYHAAESLGRLGDPRAIVPLQSVADNSKDKLRDVALASLARITPVIASPEPEPEL